MNILVVQQMVDSLQWNMPILSLPYCFNFFGHIPDLTRLQDFVGGFRPPGAAAPQVPMGGQAGIGTGPTVDHDGQLSVDTAVRPRISLSSPTTAAERARLQKHHAPAQMNPHLQVMCGPLLRYDTVDPNGTYRGACMIVSAYISASCATHVKCELIQLLMLGLFMSLIQI